MRKFNITGKVIPEKHYYVDLTPQLEKLMALVEDGTYFIINRPRQFGKTTMLNFFARSLRASKDYAPVLLSCESFVQRADITETEFYAEVNDLIVKDLRRTVAIPTVSRQPVSERSNSRREFFKWLGEICQGLQRKIVLLIDEIDALPETVVIGFLAGLREMFLERDHQPAPYAVCLAGVHDIKNLKARYRDETRSLGSASPFNIAVDYELPPFSRENIRQYFSQHTAETGQEFADEVIDRVAHVTNGQPWLVSVLAKNMIENFAPDRRQKILPEHAEAAIQKMLNSRNSNFESLFKNARHPNIFPIVLDLLLGRRREYNVLANNIDLGVKYGVFAEKNQQLVLANQIYAQALYKHFREELETSEIQTLVAGGRFEDQRGNLDFQRVLQKFQDFMKAKGPQVVKNPDFREATAQLLLLSYLDLLVNGKGWTFREVQSGEGRIDALCCYKQQKEVVELKLWYGERRYEEGLEQLSTYLESEGLDHGYLVVFDRREISPREYTFAELQVAGKKIQAWVI